MTKKKTTSKRNPEYWHERSEILQENLLKHGDEAVKRLEIAYKRALREIEKEISTFYQRFADENGMDYATAKKTLNSDDIKRFRMELDDYIKKGKTLNYSKQWAKELENASIVYRMTRLKSLQIQIQQQIELLYGEINKELEKTLVKIYEEGYYRQLYGLEQGTGIIVDFTKLDTKTVLNVVHQSWAANGSSFSDTVWKNKTQLLTKVLDEVLPVALIRGDTAAKTIAKIQKLTNNSWSNAARIVLTESAAASGRATFDAYKEFKVEKYEFLATLDGKTCDICGGMEQLSQEQKGIALDLYKIGSTAPPLHPRCRCTTVPYFDDLENEVRAARDENGKTIFAKDMAYKEWAKEKGIWDEEAYKQLKKDLYGEEKEKFVKNSKDVSNNTTNNEAENDDGFFDKIKNIFGSNKPKPKDEILAEILAEFDYGLDNIQNTDVQRLLKQVRQEVKISINLKENRSKHSRGKITLGTEVTPSSIAHELFHCIDFEHDISTKDTFKKAIANDYKKIRGNTDGIYNSIIDMLYSKYPDAFVKKDTFVKFKEEYRGISDVLEGMTGGTEKFGYGHGTDYWAKSGRLEKETWAQFGRIFYDDNKEVINMAKDLFGDTFIIVTSNLRRIK